MIKNNFSIKYLQIINLLLSLFGLTYLLVNFSHTYFFITITCFLIFGIIGVNSGYHRYFSHKSFETYKPVAIIMAFIGTLATLGSLISWVAIHRFHHVHADKPEDPHSPKYIGNFNAYIYNWKRSTISKKYIKDLLSEPYIIFIHRNYYKIIFFYIFLLFLIDPWLIIFAYAIPSTGCLNGVAAVTVISHIHGYKSHKSHDDAKNSWIASIMSLGEGWHNNHHVSPYKWKQGEKWWEIDPSSWFIRLVKIK